MAELRQVPGGRETPQGELRPAVVEEEVPRSPVAEEPRGDGSNSSEAKLFPGEEEELDPRIQVRGPMGRVRSAGFPEELADEGTAAGKESKLVNKPLPRTEKC